MRGAATCLIASSLAAVTLPAADEAPRVKLYLEEPGIYRVTHEELVAAGLPAGPWPSARVGVESFGEPVPCHVDDGGDGQLGPGDAVELVGQRLRGEYSYLDEYSRFNCYTLRFDLERPARTRPLELARGDQAATPAPLRSSYHLERDLLMLRFAERPNRLEESWYWAKLTQQDKEPFEQVLDLRDLEHRGLAADAIAAALSEATGAAGASWQTADELRSEVRGAFATTGSATLTLDLRGWSTPRFKGSRDIRDHEVEVLVNGARVAVESWDGKEPHRVTLDLPTSALVVGDNRLNLRVPTRSSGGSAPETLIDVVMLNWVEISYPLSGEVAAGQVPLEVAAGRGGLVRLTAPTARELVVASSDGWRLTAPVGPDLPLAFVAPAGGRELWVAGRGELRRVDEVVLDRPSALRSTERQADYLVIAHRSLVEAVAPLVEMHRRRGLEVAVVDVQDVFDEFNHGVVNPRAIHDFVSHAYHRWERPAPRFVLLVGDASWDYKNPLADDERYADWTYRPNETSWFIKNASTPYAEGAIPNQRNLVPTWPYGTHQGHAASDTWFACVDGDDELPDLAIGRLPVVTPEEVAAIVDKTVAFVEQPELGPWRRDMLFIANESVGFQGRTDALVDEVERRGFVADKLYPSASEAVTAEHSQRIVRALDRGVGLIHFIGHGGRYIWRTGPPDLKLNRDLFTLDHLDALVPTRRLAVVLSLTCYSAPFDHPSADSIGEKLLRLAGRGAVAVFAASWRNSPSPTMGRVLVEELTRPGATIGEAVMRAKRVYRDPILVQTYNLLGDPAVPVGAPRTVALEVATSPRRTVVRGVADAPIRSGRALVEWLGRDGRVLFSEEVELRGPRFVEGVVPAQLEPGQSPAAVRTYLWSPELGWDAVGWAEVPATDEPAAPDGAAGGAPPVERRAVASGGTP